MKLIIAFIISVLLIMNIKGVSSQVKFKTSASGLKYRIISAHTEKKIKLNDIITFNLVEKTDKDSILFSSYNLGSDLKLQIRPAQDISDLMDVFLLLYEKDSVLINIPTDSIFKNNEKSRPTYLPKGSNVYFVIKIENVQTEEESLANEIRAIEAEKIQLSKYLSDNKLNPLVTSSGLLYVITKATKTQRPEPGDTVVISYTARTLDGQVFDSTIESVAVKAGIEYPGRKYGPINFIIGKENIITAWDEGLLLMNEGARATFIIPSQLAYGSLGYGKLIKPYSTILIDVELHKIKTTSTKNIIDQNTSGKEQKMQVKGYPILVQSL